MSRIKRGVRGGVEDRWHRQPQRGELVRYPADNANGPVWCIDGSHAETGGTLVCTARHGTGKRWMARWVDRDSNERSKSFDRKSDAQRHIDQMTTALGTGTYADPLRSAITFGTVAEGWVATKAKRAPKTVAGYRGLLDTQVLPKWKDEPLRDITHERLQTWITWLSTDPSARQRQRPSRILAAFPLPA